MCQFEQIIGNNAENNGIFLRGVISAPSRAPFSDVANTATLCGQSHQVFKGQASSKSFPQCQSGIVSLTSTGKKNSAVL